MNEITPDEAVILIEAAKELKEAQEQKPQLEALLAHPGWGILQSVAETQIKARQREVMGGPVGKGKSLAEQEWLKGEASGMRLLLGLPGLIIEHATHTLENADDSGIKPTTTTSSDDGDPFAAGD